MLEETAINGGERPVSLAPRLRVVTTDHEPLPEEPSPHQLRGAVGSLETCVHHNFKAVQQDLDDIRAHNVTISSAVAEIKEALSRTEGLVHDMVRVIDELSKRLYRSEAPTLPALPTSEDLDAG